MDEGKPSNPKDLIGCNKVPLSLVPASALAYAALAHLNGALKYGAWNWRKAGVKTSIYLDAALRHLYEWQNGEECDPEDGVPHLAAALACINIIIDAREAGMLTDDRPPSIAIGAEIRRMQANVITLKNVHAEKNPKHWTIEDE